MPQIVDKILRIGEGKQRRKLEAAAAQVNAIEDDFKEMSDEELQGQTAFLKERLAAGDPLDSLLPEAFATVREAAWRVLGQRHFDVQLMGGAALHFGNIAEMKTGEGKTLVATLPTYLNALTGDGVHVVTVNDYLARYHAEWMGRVYHFLGLTVGMVLPEMTPEQRRDSYNCDITYGTNNEFGFDYLRDNMATTIEECVQRGHHYAIVDEVDSILIDEARTPLIISGPADDTVKWYDEFAKLVGRLRPDADYEFDEKKRTVSVLESGIDRVEDHLGIDNLYDAVNTPLISYLNNAIRAKELFRRDRDYVVLEGEVLIVDEHTGRILHGRRYNEGLHQAIEAKEGVTIREEYQTLATITLQNYFRLYEKLAGMTGTAMTEASEFNKIYKLGVIPIPTNKPLLRADQGDLVYRTEDAKYTAIVDDIAERHALGQPMLVGTVSVEKSEHLSGLLKRRGIPHTVLNAKQHDSEAHIVAQAGRRGAVTVATNMAGRGTDIMLGGSVEFLADEELRNRGLDPVEHADEYEAAWPTVLEQMREQVATEHDEVNDIGGLYVLGTERHESRRIDNQLRGRSGRQGDPGESRFYLSLQDDLMRLFKSDWVEWVLTTMKIPDDVPIDNKRVTGAIASAQSQVEAQNFEMRKDILKYDDVMSRQREVIYTERRRVLEGADLEEQVRGMINDTVEAYVAGATDGFPEEWELGQLWNALRQLYPVGVDQAALEDEAGGMEQLTREFLVDAVQADAHAAYDRREEELTAENLRELERQVLMSVLDRKWREHLYEMDYLREGIGLRAYSQRDPLVEYQREGFELFSAMMDSIKEEAVGFLFHVQVQLMVEPDPETELASVVAPADGAQPADRVADDAHGMSETGATDDTGALDPEAVDVDADAAEGAATAREAGQAAARRPHVMAKGLAASQQPRKLAYSAPTVDGDSALAAASEAAGSGPAAQSAQSARSAQSVQSGRSGGVPAAQAGEFANVSRNELCPCGSGRKFKRCHGDPARRNG